MPRRCVGALLALLVALAASPLQARQTAADYYGQTIQSIAFDVEGRPDTSPALLQLVDVAVGRPLRVEDVRSSEDHLASRYDGVSVTVAPAAGGVALTFALVPHHPISRLDIQGDPGELGPTALRDRVEQRYGGVPTGERPDAVAATATEALNDEGYLDAKVTSNLTLRHNPDTSTLSLIVDAGPLTRIVRNDVVSSLSSLTPAEIERRTGSAVGQPYRRRALDQALSALEDDLRSKGYYEAQATQIPQRLSDGIALSISVDAGPLVELRVEPPDALPGSVDDLIPIERLRSADRDLLEDSRRRIELALRNDGYWKGSASFRSDPEDDGKRLVVTFTITRGLRYYVGGIDLPAETAVPRFDVLRDLGMAVESVFSQPQFEARLERVKDRYRSLGYYQVEARPTYDELPAAGGVGHVLIHPNITEGPLGTITEEHVVFVGPHQIQEAQLLETLTSRQGKPYVAAEVARDDSAIRTRYMDFGFQDAAVSFSHTVANNGRDVRVTFTVSEGPRYLVGDVIIAGNEHISDQEIRDAITLHPGDPLGASALASTRAALNELGVFRRVDIAWQPPVTGDPHVDLIISVVEAKNTTIAFGGGVEAQRHARAVTVDTTADRLEFAPRGFFEIGRRNLGGRNRTLDFFSRVSLRPRDAPGDPVNDGKGFGFAEYRAALTYDERRAFRTNSDLLLSVSSEQGVQTSFNFARRSANAEFVHRVTPHVSFSGRYELQFTRLFDERFDPGQTPGDKTTIDRLFPQVRLSIVSTSISHDSRDNPLSPSRGSFLSADFEAAARAIGSEVGYVKAFFQASGFKPLDSSARTVFAARVELGLAHGFPRTAPKRDDSGQIVLGPDGQPIVETVQDLPISQRFFAGGSTSVRGFEQDRLGVPAIIQQGFSVGGNGVVVLNAEIRRVIGKLFGRDFAVVGFLDGGNVFANASDVSLGDLRAAAGVGLRYQSKLGPVRVDFGFKLNNSPVILEHVWEYYLSFGEAF